LREEMEAFRAEEKLEKQAISLQKKQRGRQGWEEGEGNEEGEEGSRAGMAVILPMLSTTCFTPLMIQGASQVILEERQA
jgi:hypothetical protein